MVETKRGIARESDSVEIRSQMITQLIPKVQRLLVLSVGATVLLNAIGASLLFVYFTFIESGLFNEAPLDITTRLTGFIVRLSIIMCAVTALSAKPMRVIRRKMREISSDDDGKKLGSLVGDLMNLPYHMAFLSTAGWLTAVVLFGFLPSLFQASQVEKWHMGIHPMVGIIFVGAPFTVISVYFTLEWILGEEIRRSFPPASLLFAPSCRTISVLPKMMVVSLVMGVVPVSAVSYITLSQIHAIHAGRQEIGSFFSQMPLVIGFVLLVVVTAAVGLSVLLARSVSRPLRRTASAMDSVRSGELDVNIPVVSNDEIGLMGEGFNRMMNGLRERDFIRQTFGSYLSPEVVANILRSPDGVNLGGELREITILVSDLRGFTSLTSTLGPEVVLKVVNHYLESMVDVIMSHGGTIDEFTGDGILAFFGAPRHMDNSQETAVRCALDMQNRMPDLNAQLAEIVSPEAASEGELLKMGIAVNSGELIVGNLGSEKRKKYGAVGIAINVAFRMERHAAAGEIVISSDIYEKIRSHITAQPVHGVELKGIDVPLTLYKVTSGDFRD
ncbi:MAG TPA: adenylate/guanylate cyclase domain-containing protein [Desulfomonilaceae bacterium]|nr:adenylate/guanylate cyclase domain-containing protein [Desulfomonilaceae bacterium]